MKKVPPKAAVAEERLSPPWTAYVVRGSPKQLWSHAYPAIIHFLMGCIEPRARFNFNVYENKKDPHITVRLSWDSKNLRRILNGLRAERRIRSWTTQPYDEVKRVAYTYELASRLYLEMERERTGPRSYAPFHPSHDAGGVFHGLFNNLFPTLDGTNGPESDFWGGMALLLGRNDPHVVLHLLAKLAKPEDRHPMHTIMRLWKPWLHDRRHWRRVQKGPVWECKSDKRLLGTTIEVRLIGRGKQLK